MKPDLLLAHLDRIGDAPDAIPRLRQFILDLAVRGRLVEHNPADEPASILLNKIRAEKTRLVKQGSLKHREPSGITALNGSTVLTPLGWVLTTLGEVTYKITDGAHKTPTYVDEGVPFISVKDFSGGALDFSNTRLIPANEHATLYKRCDPRRGDILIGRIGTLGKAVLVDTDREFSLFVSVGLIRFSHEFISPRYFRLVLNSPLLENEYNRIKVGGATHTNKLNLGDLHTVSFPLPPLAEQHRIVAKVGELMGLCNRLEEVGLRRDSHRDLLTVASHRLLDDGANDGAFQKHAHFFFGNLSRLTAQPDQIKHLRQTVLNLAVRGRLLAQDPNDESATDLVRRIQSQKQSLLANNAIRKTKACRTLNANEVPHAIPNNWKWIRLGEITDIGTGSTPSRTQPLFWNGSIPWVTSGSTSLEVINNGDEFVTEAAVKSHRLRLYQPGTLLVALYGQGKTRGQVAELAIESTINQACAAVCPLPGFESIFPYLKLLLERNYDEVRLLSVGGTQPNLNVQKIKEVLVPLPPIPEQQRIAIKVTQLLSLCDQLESQIAGAQERARNLLESVFYHALNDGIPVAQALSSVLHDAKHTGTV
jgi:type I restriction enzyme S subunit